MQKPSFHDTSLKTGERDKIEEMIDNTERRGRGGRQSDRQTDRESIKDAASQTEIAKTACGIGSTGVK